MRSGCQATHSALPPIEQPNSIQHLWQTYDEAHHLEHWEQYADGYLRHFPKPCATAAPRSFRLLEIGVQSGGNARAWKRYFGQQLYYAGVDIEPKTKRTQSEAENMFVEIGSQANATFLEEVCRKHGPFDAVVDDGSHRPGHMWTALRAIFPSDACMSNPSAVYVIEDTHVMMMQAGVSSNPFLAKGETARDVYDLAGEAFWSMHHRWTRRALYPGRRRLHPIFLDRVDGVFLYDSIMFISRGPGNTGQAPKVISRGKDSFGYGRGAPSKQLRDVSTGRRTRSAEGEVGI